MNDESKPVDFCNSVESMEHRKEYDKAHGYDFEYVVIDQTKPFTIGITKATGKKCARCWLWRNDVNRYQWSDVCKRCNDALDWIFERLSDDQRLRWVKTGELDEGFSPLSLVTSPPAP